MKVSQLPYRRVTREEMTAGLRHVIERGISLAQDGV